MSQNGGVTLKAIMLVERTGVDNNVLGALDGETRCKGVSSA